MNNFKASLTNSEDADQSAPVSLNWVHTVCIYICVKQETDTFECSYFAVVLKFKSLLSLQE